MAASQNAEQMLKDLLKWWQKSNPDFTKTAIDSGNKATLIHLASEKGYVPIVKELIAMGADVNSQDSNSTSSLHLASRGKHLEVMKLLLENGANPNAVDSKKSTPLHDTCEIEYIEGTELLLQKGANINMLDEEGYTPLYLALETGLVEICEVYFNHMPELVNQVLLKANQVENYPIHIACHHGEVDVVKLLIRKGANPTVKNSTGDSPIRMAIRAENCEVVKLLLQRFPKLIKETKGGCTLLHTAAGNKSDEIVRELLKHNMNINSQSSQIRLTPLHIACAGIFGSKAIVKLLIENNANLNLKDINGCTPLHLAIKTKNLEIAEILLQSKKCNLKIKNRNGKTALDVSLEENHLGIAKIISKEIDKLLDDQGLNQSKISKNCVICFEAKNGIFALLPCYHANSCEKCSIKIVNDSEKCPICRANVQNYQKIYI